MYDISLKKNYKKKINYTLYRLKLKFRKNKQIKIYIFAINSTYEECVAKYNWQLYAILIIQI